VIQLDIEPTELGRHYPNEVSLLGDAKVTLEAMLQVCDVSTASRRAPWVSRVQGFVSEWWAGLESLTSSDASPIRPERLSKTLSEIMPTTRSWWPIPDTQVNGPAAWLTSPSQTRVLSGAAARWAGDSRLGSAPSSPRRIVR